jgi:hypothetical protein
MEKVINGIRMEIPDDATRETLLQDLHRSDDSIVYAITPSGEHRVLNEGDSLASEQGDRLGIVSRFRTGMRDTNRIKAEIKLLEEEYGAERIAWASDYSWIKIEKWKLPPKYNATQINVLVLVPDKYGYGLAYRDFFVPEGLQIRNNGSWTKIPHNFDRFPYQNLLESNLVNELQRNGWSYQCLHPEHWSSSDNIITYLSQVYTFLSDPFAPWKG